MHTLFKIPQVLLVITMLCNSHVYAQLCTGNLGAPVVNLTFGAGTAVHAGAVGGGITSYTYSSADFPYDGSYTIENSTAGSGSVWWSTKDHTGDAGGYMMVVNASISTSDYFYKNMVSGLCPNTTYEFAAWVINLLRSQDKSPPNITFQIESPDGTVLNSYTTGAIPLAGSAVWKQYGFFFTTPANTTSVVIRMRNNSAGGAPANDLALDDITFRPCGPNVDATIDGGTSTKVCANVIDTVLLSAQVAGGYVNPAYQWQVNEGSGWQDIVGANSLSYSYVSESLPVTANYLFRLITGEGSTSLSCGVLSNEVSLSVEEAPQVSALLGSASCVSYGTQLEATADYLGKVYYYWNFGDSSTGMGKQTLHVYSGVGTYYVSLVGITAYGCVDTADDLLAVEVASLPSASFSASPIDTTIFMSYVTVADNSTGANSCVIHWADGDESDCNANMHTYRKAGTYNIMQVVINDAGCTDTAYFKIIKQPEYRLFIPNAFTPNGDGANDVFKPQQLGVYSYTMQIYNAWGIKVFESTDIENGWDGRYKDILQNPGVFVYQIQFRDEVSQEWHNYKGSLTLLR